MKKFLFFFLIVLSTVSCNKNPQDEKWKSLDDTYRQRYFVNQFAFNMMNVYYLWKDEIQNKLNAWKGSEEPVSKVKSLRYKDAQGRDVDKWTVLTDNIKGMQEQVDGNTKSMGIDFSLYAAGENNERVAVVVNFTYEGSPAALAGIKRGDVIVAIDGQTLTPDNYKDIINETILGSKSAKLAFNDGREISLEPVQMYLNPVGCHKIIEKEDRKIGYLFFSSFTRDAAADLVNVFSEFNYAGITELVLDLRYNGGGYMLTSEVLASMIAPEKVVNAKCIFQRDIFNSILTETWGEECTQFNTDFTIEGTLGNYDISTSGANPNIDKLTVIMTKSSASASESTVCGLMPYMDVTIVGQNSYGKYCGGYIVESKYWYDLYKKELSEDTYNAGIKYTDNWGIYVMVSRYADKDGNTPCMPDGFEPDIKVDDDPLDGYELGDENETMLYTAINGKAPERSRSGLRKKASAPLEFQFERPTIAIKSKPFHK